MKKNTQVLLILLLSSLTSMAFNHRDPYSEEVAVLLDQRKKSSEVEFLNRMLVAHFKEADDIIYSGHQQLRLFAYRFFASGKTLACGEVIENGIIRSPEFKEVFWYFKRVEAKKNQIRADENIIEGVILFKAKGSAPLFEDKLSSLLRRSFELGQESKKED